MELRLKFDLSFNDKIDSIGLISRLVYNFIQFIVFHIEILNEVLDLPSELLQDGELVQYLHLSFICDAIMEDKFHYPFTLLE